MTVSDTHAPDIVLHADDPGDDISRRFRYQWTFAAITCCSLLDDNEDVIEVFCEHHEDVLVKYRQGQFSGIQIKTRQPDQELWKATDDAVVKSCCRFAALESDFPGHFIAYKFLTNHPFSSARSRTGFPYLLQEIQRADNLSSLDGPAGQFVSKIASKSDCTVDQTFSALRKTVASHDLPKLADIPSRLADTLASVWEEGANSTNPALHRAAQNLVAECMNASSLAHENLLPAYLTATTYTDSDEPKAKIDGKRFDRLRVISSLEFGLNSSATLDGDLEFCPAPGEGDTDLLLQKLDAGGFSVVTRNSAVDLRNKADVLGLKWIAKHGEKRGLKQYDHIRSTVLSDAAKAFEKTKDEDSTFGLEMLGELREEFKSRRQQRYQLYDSSDEHLEGFAYGLTAECKVRWSINLPWEAE